MSLTVSAAEMLPTFVHPEVSVSGNEGTCTPGSAGLSFFLQENKITRQDRARKVFFMLFKG
jgi:hypothetical protein